MNSVGDMRDILLFHNKIKKLKKEIREKNEEENRIHGRIQRKYKMTDFLIGLHRIWKRMNLNEREWKN